MFVDCGVFKMVGLQCGSLVCLEPVLVSTVLRPGSADPCHISVFSP